MRILRFLFLAISLTSVALLYVYQQTEIVRLAYSQQKDSDFFKELLDKNSLLRYNINRKMSLVNLGDILHDGDYVMPDNYQLVLLGKLQPKADLRQVKTRRQVLGGLFVSRNQAEAKTINNP